MQESVHKRAGQCQQVSDLFTATTAHLLLVHMFVSLATSISMLGAQKPGATCDD